MVYKKYIKKNGKVYGPYLYHSRRVNGKVVSEYHGGKKEFDYKKYVIPAVSVFFLALLVYTAFNFELPGVSGNVVMDLGANYQEGQALQGKLDIFLNEGELIPASSKIIFETDTQKYEYILQDLVSDSIVEGDFYLSEKQVSGSGLGFGDIGTSSAYPIVYFTLDVYSSSEEPQPEQVENQTNESLEPAPGLPDAISNFFLALTPTGQVTMELDSSNEGQVVYGESFTLNLLDGQTAEIVSESVYTDTGQLPDNSVELTIEELTAVVTTPYVEEEQGFGQNYLGDATKELSVNLDNLNMLFDKGTLKVSLVYEQEELISLTTLLGDGQVEAQEGETVSPTPEEQVPTPEPEPTPVPTPEPEPQEPTINGLPSGLSSAERAALVAKFGETTIEKTKAKLIEDKIIIRYELGNYWVEHSYDVALSKEVLNEQMNQDLEKWLRDIVNSFYVEEPVEEDLEDLLGNYSI